jgi:hypothetical protein
MPASSKNFAALSGGKTAQFRASLRVLAASPAHYAGAAVSSLAPDTGTRLISNRKGISLA